METSLGQSKYHELVQWQHPRDSNINWSYIKLKNSRAATGDDGVAVVPVINDSKEPLVILQSHIRPPRIQGKNGGITIEVPAGLTTDADAKGQNPETNAKRELEEETGLKVKKMHKAVAGIPGDVGAESGTCGFYVAECENSTNIGPKKEPDVSELALFSVPLKDALTYLMDATKRGVDVTTIAFVGVLAALQQT
jgi:8-oxo-dGTP pyrophosphatase MutT (NUDIX family)